MAYGTIVEFDVDLDTHRTIMEKIGDGPFDGLILHVAGPSPNGVHSIDVWESKDDLDRSPKNAFVQSCSPSSPSSSATDRPPEPERVLVPLVDVWLGTTDWTCRVPYRHRRESARTFRVGVRTATRMCDGDGPWHEPHRSASQRAAPRMSDQAAGLRAWARVLSGLGVHADRQRKNSTMRGPTYSGSSTLMT